MSTLMRDMPRAMAVRLSDDALTVELEDGRTLIVPLAWFPRLLKATPQQREHFELVGRGIGIHWPDLDEDLSVQGLLNPPSRQPAKTVYTNPDHLADSDHPANGSGPPMRRPPVGQSS